jgi:pimeloyl-ACP methyl ester carboxylesterase
MQRSRSRLCLSLELALAALVAAGPAAAQSPAPCAGVDAGPRARCGTLTVAEDRAGGDGGRQIAIRYLVIPAARPAGREPVFLFAGGPGAGSTGMAGLATGPFGPVGRTRDIVMVDQRGTGGSNPLACPLDLIAKPALAFGHVFDPAVFAACRPGLEQRADLRLYTTERAIEDVDEVRAHLGYDRVLLWGGSYGTRIAQAYARRYPNRVAALVLDGVVPFDFRAPAGYARSLQQSVDRVFADCRAAPACDSAHPDLAAGFERIVERLRSKPESVTIRRRDGSTAAARLALGDFAYAVRGILYSSAGARGLPELLSAAARTGDLTPFAQAYWDRAANFNADFADGLHFAIFCAEDVPFIGPAEIPELVHGAFIGRYLIDEYATVCRDWVRAPLDQGARAPLRIDAPALLLSGWFDPVTPPETGERVAAGLPNGRHLVVRNEAHGAGFGCALPATLHVLVKGTLEGLPAVCAGVTNLFAGGAGK